MVPEEVSLEDEPSSFNHLKTTISSYLISRDDLDTENEIDPELEDLKKRYIKLQEDIQKALDDDLMKSLKISMNIKQEEDVQGQKDIERVSAECMQDGNEQVYSMMNDQDNNQENDALLEEFEEQYEKEIRNPKLFKETLLYLQDVKTYKLRRANDERWELEKKRHVYTKTCSNCDNEALCSDCANLYEEQCKPFDTKPVDPRNAIGRDIFELQLKELCPKEYSEDGTSSQSGCIVS